MESKLDKSAKQLAWHQGYHQPHVIVDVVRWTATQAICSDGNREIRFRISDGAQVGGKYGNRAEAVTPKILKEIHRARYASAIRSVCHSVGEAARNLAQLEKRHADPAAMSIILKGLNEQKALLGDWIRTLSVQKVDEE